MKHGVISYCMYFFLVLFSMAVSADNLPVTDLELKISSIEYFDGQKKVVVNKNNESKTQLFNQVISLNVVLKNLSLNEALGTSVYAELYYLVSKRPKISFPNITNNVLAVDKLIEIKSNEKIWFWNKTYQGKVIREFGAEESKKIILDDIELELPISPTLYQIEGMAIRVFARSFVQKDLDYSNNVDEFFIRYPM